MIYILFKGIGEKTDWGSRDAINSFFLFSEKRKNTYELLKIFLEEKYYYYKH